MSAPNDCTPAGDRTDFGSTCKFGTVGCASDHRSWWLSVVPSGNTWGYDTEAEAERAPHVVPHRVIQVVPIEDLIASRWVLAFTCVGLAVQEMTVLVGLRKEAAAWKEAWFRQREATGEAAWQVPPEGY